jgi:hypothetical protein
MIHLKAKSGKQKVESCVQHRTQLSIFRFLLFILTISLHSCQENAGLSKKDRAKISEDVKEMLHQYVSDIKEKGLTAELDYLDNSSDFFWAPPGYGMAISYDSVAAILKTNADHFKSIDNSYDSLSVIPLKSDLAIYSSPLKSDLAIYSALITSAMIDIEGSKSTVRLIETGVVIKRRNGWKLLSGQTSLITPNPY